MADQDLLRQFSCMGTQDKDVLISDLHDLLGSQLSREGCAFFLDMTNWNLQAAVGAYYDFYGFNQVSLPEMSLVEDITIGNGETLPPGTPFTKIWRIKNSGSSRWPPGVFLSQKSGHTFNGPPIIELPCLNPQEELNVSVNLESPIPSGEYQSQWRLCNSDGAVCGEAIWVIIKVEEVSVIGITQQFSSISTHESGMELDRIDASSNCCSNPFASPQSNISSNGLSPILPTSDLIPVSMPTMGVVSSSSSELYQTLDTTVSTSAESGITGMEEYNVSDSGTGLHECSVFMDSPQLGVVNQSSLLNSSQDMNKVSSLEVRKLADISYDATISQESAHELDTSIEDQQSL